MEMVLPMLTPVGEWFGANPLARLFLVLVAFDTLSGMLLAFQEQRVNSSVGTAGLIRKFGVLLGIAVAETLEPYAKMPDLSEWAAAAFCVTEGMSIFENLGKLGVVMPSFIRDALEKLNPKIDVK